MDSLVFLTTDFMVSILLLSSMFFSLDLEMGEEDLSFR